MSLLSFHPHLLHIIHVVAHRLHTYIISTVRSSILYGHVLFLYLLPWYASGVAIEFCVKNDSVACWGVFGVVRIERPSQTTPSVFGPRLSPPVSHLQLLSIANIHIITSKSISKLSLEFKGRHQNTRSHTFYVLLRFQTPDFTPFVLVRTQLVLDLSKNWSNNDPTRHYSPSTTFEASTQHCAIVAVWVLKAISASAFIP